MREEKGVAEDKMVRYHHKRNGLENEQTLGDMKDRGAWHAAFHGVAKSWTGLKNNNKSGSSILRNIQNKRKLVLINDTFALTLKALHLHTCNHILICHFKKYFS